MRSSYLIPLLLVLTFSACSPAPTYPDPSVSPSETTPIKTNTSAPEATATEALPVNPTAPPITAVTPTAISLEATPDFSAVTVFETTHLMDPNYFQISLEAWPKNLPDDVSVQLDGIEYSCEILFPDDYPNRLYCWGPAPSQGTQSLIEVYLSAEDEPVFQARFVVPRP